jgi:hypothetical protein
VIAPFLLVLIIEEINAIERIIPDTGKPKEYISF